MKKWVEGIWKIMHDDYCAKFPADLFTITICKGTVPIMLQYYLNQILEILCELELLKIILHLKTAIKIY